MITGGKCFERKCRHFLGVSKPDGTELTERVICRAYPDGIPADIITGDNLHGKVRDDQYNEIVFEKLKEGEYFPER